jgi:acetoacetate decarboxylase
MISRQFPLFISLVLLIGLATCSQSQEASQPEETRAGPELEAYSMPWSAPLFPPPPAQFRGNRIISVVFQSEIEAVKRLVPPPLVPNPDGLMYFYVGEFGIEAEIIERFPYLEAGIGVPVQFDKKPGDYFVVLYLDKALPIVAGREKAGWPKKDAEIIFQEDSGIVQAKVSRFGETIA